MLLFLLFFLYPTLTLSLNQEGLYLHQFKLSISDPTQSLSTWNSRDTTPCNWTGVTCDSVRRSVNSLDLSNFNLAGPLPTASLCRLPSLSSLSLSNNSFNSSLTVQISTCQHLRYLNLGQNLFTGLIPETLADIPNLAILDLSSNSFSGGVPVRFGEFRLLESLCIQENLLDGTIPSSIGNITSLKLLRLAYNPFYPSRLAPELGNLTSLEDLWLAGCNLVGQIPASIGKLSRLTNLDLTHNKLDGSIPSSLTELKSIVQIELYNNSFSGELPTGLSNLTALRRFDVSTNQLGGTIPDELCQLPLGSLNLQENRFEGSLPESITRSPNLYELRLFNNKLSGQLPSSLGTNSPLVCLDVSYNQFSGPIPENLCQKGALEELVLIYNLFSGELPAKLGECRSLDRVRLRKNRFSGSVPANFWGLPRVSLLELAENSFDGELSNMISSAQNLSVLLISNNQFSGSIPDSIGLLNNIVEFSGSGNKFTGQIPAALVNLTQLDKLDLSGNELVGNFLEGIQSWKNLNELNLANNRLFDLNSLIAGKSIHCLVVVRNLCEDLYLNTAILTMYSKLDSLEDARLLFEKMSGRDCVVWNVMISTYFQKGYPEESMKLLMCMGRSGVRADLFTAIAAIPSIAELKSLEWGKQMHAHVVRNGSDYQVSVHNSLIDMYCKCDHLESARKIFDLVTKKTMVSWSLMIKGYVSHDQCYEALSLFTKMKLDGMGVDYITVINVLPACVNVGVLERVKYLHGFSIKCGLNSTPSVDTALLISYAKRGCILMARKLFDGEEIYDKDIITWNSMISAYSKHGEWFQCFDLYNQMKQSKSKPDRVTFLALLTACVNSGFVKEGWDCFKEMKTYGCEPNQEHYACMVDLLGRAGHINEATELIKTMPFKPDARVWGPLLSACKMHSETKLAEYAAEKLITMEPKNAGNYILLSNIYAAAGKWDGVAKMRGFLRDRGLKKIPGCSWLEINGQVHEFRVADRSHPKSDDIYTTLGNLEFEIKEARDMMSQKPF